MLALVLVVGRGVHLPNLDELLRAELTLTKAHSELLLHKLALFCQVTKIVLRVVQANIFLALWLTCDEVSLEFAHLLLMDQVLPLLSHVDAILMGFELELLEGHLVTL